MPPADSDMAEQTLKGEYDLGFFPAKAEPEGRTSVRGASLKDAGRLTFAAAKMGAEIALTGLEAA